MSAKAQTLDEIEREADMAADCAAEHWRNGRQFEAAYALYMAIALHGAVNEVRRRRRR